MMEHGLLSLRLLLNLLPSLHLLLCKVDEVAQIFTTLIQSFDSVKLRLELISATCSSLFQICMAVII